MIGCGDHILADKEEASLLWAEDKDLAAYWKEIAVVLAGIFAVAGTARALC